MNSSGNVLTSSLLVPQASRYDGQQVRSVHIPIKHSCQPRNASEFSRASFRLNHYIGDLATFVKPGLHWFEFKDRIEGFKHRNGKRSGESAFLDEDDMGLWLHDFVDLVGEEKAFQLTVEARNLANQQVAEWCETHKEGYPKQYPYVLGVKKASR